MFKATFLSLLAILTVGAAPAPRQDDLQGAWRNPKGTVQVRIDPCGNALCGRVVGASATAIGDARDSGYPHLIGMELMHDYRPDGRRRWSGTVFVPDMARSFSSHIVLIDANHARVAGCLVGQYVCKSQIWQRL